MIYYSNVKAIKNDFIIHPGGRLNSIQIKYSGNQGVVINRQGELEIHSIAGDIIEKIPEAYQYVDGVKVLIKIRYSIDENDIVGFVAPSYNPLFDLIIDPQLLYSSYLGGSGDDNEVHCDSERDSQGNLYITGRTTSTNFPVTPGVYTTVNQGMFDLFIVKWNASLSQILYSTFIGGSNEDFGESIELGNNNNITIGGYTRSADFPVTNGAFQTNYGGGDCDAFILQLSNTGGSLIYSTFLGGDNEDYLLTILQDAAENTYAIGYSNGTFPTTPGAYQPTNIGEYDIYVTKLNYNGSSVLISTLIGGPGYDRGYNIQLDNSGGIYCVGTSDGNFPTTPGAYDETQNGQNDIVLFKLSPNFSILQYSTFIGGPGDEISIPKFGVLLDNMNQITLCGKCSNGFPTTVGAYNQVFGGGNSDVFLTKINSTLSSLLFSTYLGGSGDDVGFFLSTNTANELIISGYASIGFPTTSCCLDASYNGGNSDAFISKLNSNASQLLYSSFLGGNQKDVATSFWLAHDTIIIIGETQSPDLPVTANAYDQTYNGQTDIFLIKLIPAIDEKPTAQFNSPPSLCINQSTGFQNTTLKASNYEWNFGDGNSSDSINPLHSYSQPGNYLVSLIAQNECASDTITNWIEVKGFFEVDSVMLCDGDSVLINDVYHYLAGNYDVIYPTLSGCDSIIRSSVTFIPMPINNLPDFIEICNGKSILLDAGDCQHCYYLWSSGATGRYLSVDLEGTYHLDISIGSCSNSDSVQVKICDLFLPNVFTPNNDGINELFQPVIHGTILSYRMLVFNRWGQKLYESNDAYTGWDGTLYGNLCPTGVYYYIVEYMMRSEPYTERQLEKRGSVTILR